MQTVLKSTTDMTCGNMDLNENTQSGLKGEVQRGIRIETSRITVASVKPGILKVDDDLAADGCSEVAERDGRRYIPTTASPVHVEECGGCGAWADAAPGALPTLREEEEDDEDEVASSNTDSCSVISSSYDSLNSSTECLLLNVSHPEIFGELTGADAGVADLLRSIMEEKTSQLGKISMRCTNCLEKFHWSRNELEACLFKHLTKCWQRKMSVSHLSPIEEKDVENELESFEKENMRDELSGVKSLVSALLATEWDFKPIRCGQDAPECYRDHCKEARSHEQVHSDASSDTQLWDGDFEDDELDIEMLEHEEREMKLSSIESVEDEALNDSVVAEQRMMVMLVSAKSSIWQDKMAAVVGLTTRSTLDDLDSVLRRLWVECCGHASSLTVGEKTFTFPDFKGDLDKLSIKDKDDQCDQAGGQNQTAIESVFGKIGSTGFYTYDPVHPTLLNISFMGTMELTFTEEAEFPSHTDFYLRGADMVRPSRRSSLSAAILMRNVRPEVVCAECRESYVLLLDSSIADVRLPVGSKPHGGLFHPVGFCSMDCVVAFNQEMSPDHNDSVRVERANLVYMSNSPRAGTCRYASLELDSSVNTWTTDSTTHSAFTIDTSCSCADCASDCSQNCETCDYTDTDHSYSKGEGSPQVPTSSILARTGGTPVLTGYSSRSTSVDTPPTRQ